MEICRNQYYLYQYPQKVDQMDVGNRMVVTSCIRKCSRSELDENLDDADTIDTI